MAVPELTAAVMFKLSADSTTGLFPASTAACTDTMLAARFTPAPLVVVTSPFRVVVPVPRICRSPAASTDLSNVRSVALAMVNWPSGVVPPTSSVNWMTPPVSIRSAEPSTLSMKLMLPVPALMLLSPPRLTVFSVTAALVVATAPFSVVLPAVWTRPPVKTRLSEGWSPSVTRPVFFSVSAFVTAVVAPRKLTA